LIALIKEEKKRVGDKRGTGGRKTNRSMSHLLTNYLFSDSDSKKSIGWNINSHLGIKNLQNKPSMYFFKKIP